MPERRPVNTSRKTPSAEEFAPLPFREYRLTVAGVPEQLRIALTESKRTAPHVPLDASNVHARLHLCQARSHNIQ